MATGVYDDVRNGLDVTGRYSGEAGPGGSGHTGPAITRTGIDEDMGSSNDIRAAVIDDLSLTAACSGLTSCPQHHE